MVKKFDLTLKQLIKNLKEIQKSEIPKEEVQYIFYIIVKKIANVTAYDTNQARSSIAKLLFDKFGFNQLEYEKSPYYYWENNGYPENANRRVDNTSMSNLSETKSKGKYEVNISISDPAVYAMENGDFWFSHNHPRSNQGLRAMPISYVVDSINAQDFSKVDGLEKALEKILDKYIEMVVKSK